MSNLMLPLLLYVVCSSHQKRTHNFAPPVFRLLWRLGYELPPPHFLNFGTLIAVMGLPFGVLWSGLMWLLLFRGKISVMGMLLAAVIMAGVGFGLCMAAYYRTTARKLKLPTWEDYPTEDVGLPNSRRRAPGQKRNRRSHR